MIGGAFFPLAQSIVQRKAHRKKRTTTTTTTTVLDRSKLDAPQSSLLRKKGKGDARQSTVYRKDEEWDVSENEEADFLRIIEFFFECAPSFQSFSSLNCTYVPL